jgi:hypothetical protein
MHAANVVLLFAVLREAARVLGRPLLDFRLNIIAATFAAWWGWSPLRVETVAWSSGLLYNIAFTGTLMALFFYLRADVQSDRLRRNGYLAASVICFGCSLLVYPALIGIGPCVLLFEIYRQCSGALRSHQAHHASGRSYIAPAGWVLCSLFVAAASLWLSTHAGAFWESSVHVSLIERMTAAPYFFTYYLWRPFWPTGLAPIYASLAPPIQMAPRFVVGMAVCLGAVGFSFWKARHGSVGFLLSVLAFCAVIAPPSPLFVGITYTSDRYSQASTLVMAICLCLAVVLFGSRRLQVALTTGLGIVVLLMLPFARSQLWVWQDTGTLLHQALAVLPERGEVRASIERRLSDYHFFYQGVTDEYRLSSQPAAPGNSTNPKLSLPAGSQAGSFISIAVQDLYTMAVEQDMPAADYRTAVARLREADRWTPNLWQVHFQLAVNLLALGSESEAKQHFERAVFLQGRRLDESTWNNFLNSLGTSRSSTGA